jgi:hypothetical protein
MNQFMDQLETEYLKRYQPNHHPKFPSLRSALAAALDELESKNIESEDEDDYLPLTILYSIEELPKLLTRQWQLSDCVQLEMGIN